MIEKKRFKKKNNCILLISFILILNLNSIILLSNRVINRNDINKNFDNIIEDTTSFIQTSSSGPPNRNYFKYYKVITIDNTKVSGSGSHKNFPVLISIFDSDLHNHTQADGVDIAFSNDTTWLDHELELFKKDYNETHAQLVAWVRIPSLSTSIDTKIYMYYSNSTMGARENPSGVWDGNFKGVWHLSEDPTGTIYDSTFNSNDGTSQGLMTSGDQVFGKIDGSLNFDGNDDNVRILDAVSLDITSAITVEAWVNGTGNWWNSKYQYRKKITITNNYGSTVMANTIVKFTADTATLISTGKLRADEKDWRIGYWDGYSWIELARDVYIGWDTTNTEIWFRLQADIPDGNSDNNYYVYYGYSDETGTPTTLGLSEGIIKQQTAGGMEWNKSIDYMDNSEWGLAQAYSYSPSYTSWYVVTKISWYCSNEDSTTSQLLAGYIFDGINKLEGEEITNGKSATFTGSSVVENAYNDAIFSKPYPQPERGRTYYMALFPDSGRSASAEPIFWAIELSAGNGAYWVIKSGTWTLWGSNGDFKYQLYGYEAPNNDCVDSLGLEEQNGINKGNAPSLAFDNSNIAGFINNKVIFTNIGAGWNYVVLTYDGTNQALFVNGVLREISALTGVINTNINNLIIGDFFNGIIDEVRISSVARSADWITTEYNNQYDLSSFFTIGSEKECDNTPPTYEKPKESSNPLELGDTEVISINVTDPSGIKQVRIEFESSNHTMNNTIGNTWEYNSWTPTSIGNYTYMIYMEDINNNWNSTSGSISVVDTTPPTYSNLIEGADPLELGDTIIISINANDFAGINQSLIEFKGSNHSMTNIYGNVWQYDSWTPENWIVYQYKIYIEDKNGNWNFTNGNITVHDTTPPSPPVMTIAPSGDVSGILTFDWIDGFDPSGIFCYILIIDNESDPFITPGYIFEFNITNTGPETSHLELPEVLPSGKYYYFLAQVDGIGQQSSFTMGTFTVISVNNGPNDLLIFTIIALIFLGTIGSIATGIIIKRRTKKKVLPPRKIIPLKIIIPHINKLSNSQLAFEREESQKKIIEKKTDKMLFEKELADDKDLENRLNEIKSLGEELFGEGAYLEAQKLFEDAEKLLLKFNKKEEALLYSDLIAGIQRLIEEREIRLETLEREILEGNSMNIFELYYDIIEISKKLNDTDAINMYQSDLIQLFKDDKIKFTDLGFKRLSLEEQANSLLNNNLFEKAAELFEKCEKISHFLVQLGNEKEKTNLEKFRNKKNECLKKIS